MAIYTPRGLKIRLGRSYAFALMARLFPRIDAFRVLQLTEEVENVASIAAFIAGIVAFAARLDPVMIGFIVGVTGFSFKMFHQFGILFPPFKLLLPISRVYSWFSGYGIFLSALFVFGYFMVGWQGDVAFLVASVAVYLLAEGIDLAYTKLASQKSIITRATSSERSFFHAYRLSADQIGVTRSLAVDEEEMELENWEHVYTDLLLKWPVVVARFTTD